MSNSWFRLYSEFMTDPKVQMMPETYQRRLIMLFCTRCNGDVTLHDDEVTFLLRISNEEWQLTKAMFIAKGFIDEANNLLNWDKRQFRSDSSAQRVAKCREKKKQECNVTVTSQNRTDTDTDTDTEKEESRVVSAKPDTPSPAPFKFEEVARIWNEATKGFLPEIKIFTEKRKCSFRARWADELGKSMKTWEAFCQKIPDTPFLVGENDRGWKATIDWALAPSNISKALEGTYDSSIKTVRVSAEQVAENKRKQELEEWAKS